MSTLKLYKPITPGLRGKITKPFKNQGNITPPKNLLVKNQRNKGRNNQGLITIRHRGGGHKRLYRLIDFKRNKKNVIGIVNSIHYDPNRNVNIALIYYYDGEKRYILHPEKLKIGDTIITSTLAKIEIGNCLPLAQIPIGTNIHNIELLPKKGGQLVRSAGTSGRLVAKDKNYAIIKLPSKELRLINENCWATIGRLDNSQIALTKSGKAGRTRWFGKRPTVRGVVMNPCDHPHGGGEGKAPVGRIKPLTPWGKPALGIKTRKKNKKSNLYIINQTK